MYQRFSQVFAAVLLVLTATILTSCLAQTPPAITPPDNVPKPAAIDSPRTEAEAMLPNLLVEANGQVTVRRLGRSERSIPIGVGAALQVGDLIQTAEGRAAVFCGDEVQWEQSPRVINAGKARSVSCVGGRPSRPMPDLSWLRRVRGENLVQADEIPYVIRPRTGFVLEDRPRLEWHALTDANFYTVTLQGPSSLVLTTVVTGTNTIAYPKDWPALEGGGADYELSVEANGRHSNPNEMRGLGFTLLDGESARRVRDQERRLRERPVDDLGLTILLSELYLHDDYRLRSDSIDLLNGFDKGDEVPAIQTLLGEIYVAMGLFEHAKQAYERALVLDQTDGLPESEADTQYGLGLVSCALWNTSEAEKHFTEAKILYEELGSAEQVAAAENWLTRIADDCKPPVTPTSPTDAGVDGRTNEKSS